MTAEETVLRLGAVSVALAGIILLGLYAWKAIRWFHYVTVKKPIGDAVTIIQQEMKRQLGVNGQSLLQVIRNDLSNLQVRVGEDEQSERRHRAASRSWARGAHAAGQKANVPIPDPDDYEGMDG